MDRNPGAPPLYAQLEQILKQQIECGTYKKGDFLPTEKELMEKYELSRVTVRQAMTNLVQSGYARARRGIGTDVVYEKVADGRCHQFHGRNEKASYRNADNILQDGTDQSRGNGSKKSADSIDGAMLLPETCEECCGKTHGLYHYVSEKNLRTANRAGAIHGIAVSVSAGGTWNLY